MNAPDKTLAARAASDASDGAPSLSEQAAAFCAALRAGTVPPEVLEKARTCIFYGLGIGIACLPESTAVVAEEAMAALDGVIASGPRAATAFVSGRRLPPSAGALANAVLLHSRCQEDTSGTAHLGVAILGATLALVESGLATTRSLLEAVIAGYEVGGAMERLLGKDTMKASLRASPLYGTLAVAAASARLLELPEERVRAALDNAAAFTGGTLQPIAEGTDEWRYQVGVAARNGMQAALLARAGSVSTRRGFDGEQGFARAFARHASPPATLELGRHWNLPAVTFKPYPVCAHNQTPAALAAQLAERVRPDAIEHIRVRVNPYVVPGMLERGPFSRVSETLLSTYFCVASGLVHGTIGMASLADYDDPTVAALIARMSVDTDADVPFPSAAADVQTRDGERFTITLSRRFEDYSMSRDEVRAQLKRLAGEVGASAATIDALERFAWQLPQGDVSAVVDAFAMAREDIARRDEARATSGARSSDTAARNGARK